MNGIDYMRLALRLARRGRGCTSPNPMVGAVLVQRGVIIGRGWHRRAGSPHAEIEALEDARRHGRDPLGSTCYVTMEPCSTEGRTPACTDAIRAAGVRRVVIGATDPNPRHRGRAVAILRRGGIEIEQGVLGEECERLNEVFNHWITRGTPWVTVKAAMTLDGKIATASGESKWITGERARRMAMGLRREHDAVLVGIRTILSDDPALILRNARGEPLRLNRPPLRRVILDTQARTPLQARVVTDAQAASTLVVVGRAAPARRVRVLSRKVEVWRAPTKGGRIDLGWLLPRLGGIEITSLLVEGGGEVHASFLMDGHADAVAFFYAPMVLGGHDAHKAVAGRGARNWHQVLVLRDVKWRRVGSDLLLRARVSGRRGLLAGRDRSSSSRIEPRRRGPVSPGP
jgi:diaminohydroxyphosphoribosylaminopyrimidine deaminase / 5-amino-6-(5-phosphoribosylamino)uracil reductase